jgi:hypothetical protein
MFLVVGQKHAKKIASFFQPGTKFVYALVQTANAYWSQHIAGKNITLLLHRSQILAKKGDTCSLSTSFIGCTQQGMLNL